MAEAAERPCVRDDGGPRRVLGPIDATCVVVGAIIGVGIFFTPSSVAGLAGSGAMAMLAWGIGGAIAMCGALTFAELGGMYQRNGGQYEMLRDAYGPLPAFMFVFCNATAVQAGAIGIIAMICADRLVLAATGGEADSTGKLLIAVALVVGLVGANIMGVRWGARIQNLTVFAKLGVLAAVAAVAVFMAPEVVEIAATAEEGSGAGAVGMIFAALVPAFFAFGGWQHALWIAGEVRRPGRNLPLAIVGGVAIVSVVYLAVNWAYLRLLGYEGVVSSEAVASKAVGAVWSVGGERVVAGAVAVSAFGVLNAQFLSGPRLIYGMARDGRFFAPFARVSGTRGTPVAAIVLLGVLALALLFLAGFDALDRLLTGVVFVDGVFMALTGASLIVLRFRRANAERAVRVIGYPVVPVLFVLGEMAILVGAWLVPERRSAAVLGLAWIVAAAVCYFVFFRRPGAASQA